MSFEKPKTKTSEMSSEASGEIDVPKKTERVEPEEEKVIADGKEREKKSSAELEPSPEAEEFNDQFETMLEDLSSFNRELDELPETLENKTRIEELTGLIEILQEQLGFNMEGEAAEGELLGFEELTEEEK